MTGPTVPSEAVAEEAVSVALDAFHAACHAGLTNIEAMRAVLAAAVPVLQAQERERLETRVEYGHQTVELGWVFEHRGINYATHQRTVHFRVDEPLLIDHWSDPDNRKPFAVPGVQGSENSPQNSAVPDERPDIVPALCEHGNTGAHQWLEVFEWTTAWRDCSGPSAVPEGEQE